MLKELHVNASEIHDTMQNSTRGETPPGLTFLM